MKLEFSVKKFPVNSSVKEQSSLPFGCMLQPFAEYREDEYLENKRLTRAEDLARCSQCFAYINCYCQREPTGWTCSLCGTYSDYRGAEMKRYGKGQAKDILPEFVSPILEVDCSMDYVEDAQAASGSSAFAHARSGPPAYIALVDSCCDNETIELFKQALQTALEAIPSYGLFGLLVISKQLCMWDLRTDCAVSRHVPLLDESGPPLVPLEDVMSLDEFLVPVGQWKQRINDTLEQLESAINSETNEIESARAFGPALQGLMYYFRNLNQQNGKHDEHIGNVRVMCLLAGPPSIGQGATTIVHKNGGIPQVMPSMRAPNVQHMQLSTHGAGMNVGVNIGDSIPEVVRFYEEAAVAAAVLGVSFDVYIVTPNTIGLQMMESLCISSGGQVYLYPSVEDANLPQDIYKRLKSPVAYGALLRVRTAPEFRVGRCYGRVVPDDQYENLYHMICVDPQDSVALDFEYTQVGGFSVDGYSVATPVVQVAFQYSIAIPKRSEEANNITQHQTQANGNGSSQPVEHVRRMRIQTYAGKAVNSPVEVMQSSNPEVVFGLIFHKLLRVLHEESVTEARELISDWLIILMSNYNHNFRIRRYGTDADPLLLDANFEQCSSLSSLPRTVYALLMSPLMADRNQVPMRHGDEWSYLSTLWSCLSHDELSKAVYPLMSSYKDPNREAFPKHSLSRAAMMASQEYIFMLDAYTNIVVLYATGCAPSIVFPPAQDTMLRKQVSHLQKIRRVTPTIKWVHEDRDGSQAAQVFYQYLIDEPIFDSIDQNQGYARFLEGIRKEVHMYMKEQKSG